MSITTVNGHQNVIDKHFRAPDSIRHPTKYSRYRTDNDLFFRVLDLRLVECILCGRIHNCRLTKDGRKVFLDIDDYKQSKFSEETCVTNDWDKFTSLRPISKFSGGKEAFINQWF